MVFVILITNTQYRPVEHRSISSLILRFVFFLAENKSEYRMSESETRVQDSNFQMFKTALFFVEYDYLCFCHLRLRDSIIVSIFDIRVSYFPACSG